MKKIFYVILAVLILSASCNKVKDSSITPAMARDSLYTIMKLYYYWYNMPECQAVSLLNKGNYKDPYELLEAMRYKAKDRWSYVNDYQVYLSEIQTGNIGHGITVGLDTAGLARIMQIDDQAPLYASGVRRGWIIKKVNGTDIAPFIAAGDIAGYYTVLGEKKTGVTNTFIFRKPDGTEVTISSAKESIIHNTVQLAEVLDLTSGKTGHLVFDSFTSATADELALAFSDFKSAGVKDLIIDLRYNSGGYLVTAQTLGSYIIGNSRQGDAFIKLVYNDKASQYNRAYSFQSTPYPLDLQRVVFITSRATAFTSEAVINGLKPYIDVVIIGDTTNGKPVGMNGWIIGKKYYMWPVTFKLLNSADAGDYFSGILPDIETIDDVTRDFNDPLEVSLKEAISWLETGGGTKNLRFYKRTPLLRENVPLVRGALVEGPPEISEDR